MDVLAQIIAATQEQVRQAQKQMPLEQLKELSRRARSPRKVVNALRNTDGAVKIIGEIKRCAPHQGAIAPVPHPADLAKAYEAGGASMISVVAEPDFHCGKLSDLEEVCRAVEIPVLRKDFVISSYQLHQSRAAGADAILLAVGTLEENALVSLIERTKSLGMTPIVQAHSRLDALLAIECGAEVVTVNALDQRTMELQMDTFAQIVDVIGPEVIAVAESGVKGPRDVFRYAQDGADAVLVGKALVESEDPASLVADMVAAGSHPALARERKQRIRPNYEAR